MNLRITAASILIFTASVALNAQINFGVRAGISTSEIKLSDFDGGLYDIDYRKGNPGFHLGGLARVKVLGFFVQPELLFTMARNDLKVTINQTDFSDPVEHLGSQSFFKMDVPVIAGVKLGPFKLQAGPVATFKLGTRSDELKDLDIRQEFKGATIGYQAGVGIELANLLVDVKYEGNLSKLGDGIRIGNEQYAFDQRMSQVILSLGFLIGN